MSRRPPALATIALVPAGLTVGAVPQPATATARGRIVRSSVRWHDAAALALVVEHRRAALAHG